MTTLCKRFKDEEGVSEVVGTILTLGITVVLFSSVYAAVTQLDAPERRDHVEMVADYERDGVYDYIEITHESGRSLDLEDLIFNLLVDGASIERLRIDEDHEDIYVNTTSDDDVWSVGEEVTIEGEIFDEDDTDIELIIQNENTNRVVFDTILVEEIPGQMEIKNAYIRYRYEWRNHAEEGENIDIVAELSNVEDEDIWVNASVAGDDNPLEEEGIIELEENPANRYIGEEIQISVGATEKPYSVKVTAESNEREVNEYVRLNVGKRPAERYPRELEIGRISYSPRTPSHSDDLVVTADVFNHGPENASDTHWFMIDRYRREDESPLFSLSEPEYEEYLEPGPIDEELKDEFEENGYELDEDAELLYEVGEWFVSVDEKRNYRIDIDEDEDELYVYSVEQVASDKGLTIEDGPAPTEITGRFEIRGSGTHEIEIFVSGDEEWREDDGWEGAKQSVIIHVDPHILVVEDRSASELNEAELMSNALSGLNLDHDIREVREEEDLNITYDEHSMVIWMTGNQTGDDGPLLEEAEDDLIEYIAGDEDREGNGTLWIKGSNWYDYIDELEDKVGYESHGGSGSANGDNTLSGEGGTFGDFTFDISTDHDYFHMDLKEGDEGVEKENELNDNDDDHYGAGYETDNGQRTVVSSFLFEQIIDSGLRTALTGEVIQWTTNITARSGVDVAVTSQKIEPTAPMFMDTININATFRNNGPQDLTLNNTARLVRNQGEEIIAPPEDANLFIKANGGTANVTFTWVAEELGVHELIVKADYFGDIDQANPATNDITYKNLEISDDDIYANVHYSTLVVDSDLSEDNDYHDTTGEVIDSLKLLGYEEGSDYDVYEIREDDGLDEGPDYNNMSNYNSVFWITGERGYEDDEEDKPDLFTDDDIENIHQYLEQTSGANMLFMGEHILDFLDEEDEEDLMEYMGVSSINDEREETEALVGQENNAMGRSLRYELEETNDELNYTTFDTNGDGEVLFQGEENHNFASTYDDGSTKTIYMGVNLDRINGSLMAEDLFEDWPAGDVDPSNESNARTEFVYTSLWHFGKEDERAELRVTDYDMRFSSDHPHTGRSYHIRMEVENYGYRGVSTLVRFFDGDDYIGSENLFVEGSEGESEEGHTYFDVSPGTATAEVTWRTSNPGDRPIVVQADPEGEVEEIVDEDNEDNSIMEFNNQAKVTHPVYFFWDDMESGRENWDTEATIMNINGEHPLEYLDEDYDTDYTEILHDWEYKHDNITLTDHFSYSDPYSFWVQEPRDEADFDGESTNSNEKITIEEDNKPCMSLNENNLMQMTIEETRYMRSDNVLGTSEPAEEDSVKFISDEGANLDIYFGMRVFVFDGEEEDEITDEDGEPVKIGEITHAHDGEGSFSLSEPWTPPSSTSLSTEESIRIKVYGGFEEDEIDVELTNFTTEELGAEQLDENEWTVYYYAERETVDDGQDKETHGTFHFGSAGGESDWSRIENFKYTIDDDVDYIQIGPEDQTIVAGESVEYTALAYDEDDEFVRDVSLQTNWTIDDDAGGDWDDNIYISEKENPGEWTVEGEYDGITNETTLTVLEPDYIEIEPEEEIVNEEEVVVYRSIAYNESYGRIGIVTDETEWEIEEGAGGEWDDNVYTSENLGVWNVTGTYTFDEEEMTANATLIVRSEEMAYGENENKTAVTPTLNLTGYEEARLTLRSKYRMNSGTTGGFIMVGMKDDGDLDTEWVDEDGWAWRYAIPSESTYNREFENNDERIDSFGNQMDFAWSGTSGGGSFTWERARLNILRYVEEGYEDNVRIKFNYTQYGEGTGYGWYIDDVRTAVSRGDNPIMGHHRDVWRQEKVESRDSDEETTAWVNAHPEAFDDDDEYFKSGIDNSLITSSIDLTNARSVELSAYLKFNINSESGAPPDGFRVEVSTDGGRRWMPINQGSRSAYGVSGRGENDSHQGYDMGNGWTTADSLSRLDTDLSDFRGEIIHLRFRMITTTGDYEHYEEEGEPPGFYVDEVVLSGY